MAKHFFENAHAFSLLTPRDFVIGKTPSFVSCLDDLSRSNRVCAVCARCPFAALGLLFFVFGVSSSSDSDTVMSSSLTFSSSGVSSTRARFFPRASFSAVCFCSLAARFRPRSMYWGKSSATPRIAPGFFGGFLPLHQVGSIFTMRRRRNPCLLSTGAVMTVKACSKALFTCLHAYEFLPRSFVSS